MTTKKVATISCVIPQPLCDKFLATGLQSHSRRLFLIQSAICKWYNNSFEFLTFIYLFILCVCGGNWQNHDFNEKMTYFRQRAWALLVGSAVVRDWAQRTSSFWRARSAHAIIASRSVVTWRRHGGDEWQLGVYTYICVDEARWNQIKVKLCTLDVAWLQCKAALGYLSNGSWLASSNMSDNWAGPTPCGHRPTTSPASHTKPSVHTGKLLLSLSRWHFATCRVSAYTQRLFAKTYSFCSSTRWAYIIAGQKKIVCVCLCVNQGGTNNNRCT